MVDFCFVNVNVILCLKYYKANNTVLHAKLLFKLIIGFLITNNALLIQKKVLMLDQNSLLNYQKSFLFRHYMKYLYCFFLLLLFCSCAKVNIDSSEPSNYLYYHFKGNSSADYQIRYTGSDGNPVTETLTANEWSKGFTVKKSVGIKNAIFFISLKTANTQIEGSADVSVDNKLVSSVPISFNSGNGSTDLTITAPVNP